MAIALTTVFIVTSVVFLIFIRNLAIASASKAKTRKELARANLIGFIVGPVIVLVALLIQSILYFLWLAENENIEVQKSMRSFAGSYTYLKNRFGLNFIDIKAQQLNHHEYKKRTT